MAEAATPQGLVRLAAPMSFGLRLPAPILPEFLAAHPRGVRRPAAERCDRGSDRRRFDAALRIADLADSTLRVRRLCRVRRVLAGAPAYFARHGRPEHPRDLAGMPASAMAPAGAGPVALHPCLGRGGRGGARGPLVANNADALGPAPRAGLGLAVQPEFVVWEDLLAGRLEVALAEWSAPEIVVNIVMPPGRARPASVTALVDFLTRRFAAAPWAMAGEG